MVISPTAASGLVHPRGQLRHVRRNVQRYNADQLVLCFRGSGQDIRENRNDQQSDHRHVQANGDHLAPAEVFILGPDVLYPHRLYGEGQGRLLRWREEFLDAGAEAAKIRSPGYRQFAVYRSFECGTRAEEILQVIADAGTEGGLSERRVLALAHLDGALHEELLQIGPKIIGDENVWWIEFGHSRGGYGNCRLTTCRRHFGFCNIRRQKIDNFARHRLPLQLDASSPRSVYPTDKIRAGCERLRAPSG